MPAFATAADLERYMQRQFSAEEFAAAEQTLEMATGVIQAFTGQRIFAGSETVTVRVKFDAVFLPQLPVTSVTSVVADGEPVEDWALEPAGVIRISGALPRLVDVEYSFGYVEIPSDVQAVCLQMAARSTTNPQALRQESIGSYSVTYAETSGGTTGGVMLSVAEESVLQRYRVGGVA